MSKDASAQLIEALAPQIRASLLNPRHYMMRKAGTWLARCVIDNCHCDLAVIDTGYDCSTMAVKTESGIDLSQYSTVQEFLDGELTGNTIATYESGCGLAAESYSDALHTELLEWHPQHLKQHFSQIQFYDEDDGFPNDVLYDELIINDCSDLWFADEFGKLDLAYVLKLYESDARAELQKEAAARKRRHIFWEATRNWHLEIGSTAAKALRLALGPGRIEMNNWRRFDTAMQKLIQDFGPTAARAGLWLANVDFSIRALDRARDIYAAPKLPADRGSDPDTVV